MIKAKLTGTSGAINSQLDSNEQQLEASLEKSTPQYVGGNGIDIDNGTISNTGVTSINGQTGDLDGFALTAEIPTKTSQLENDSNYANVNQIPTKTSQLVNDSNYATSDEIPTDYYTQEEVNTLISNVTVDLSDYYTKTESDNKFADKSDVPTKTSQLTNDSQFITNTVNNLTNYYKKTETYTQTEVNNLIGSITTISFQVVDNLPSTGEANIIYLVPDTQATNNVYDEYIWVNNSWELIGSTSVDLSNYYTKTEADNKFALSANLADVATSGSYNDLSDTPTIPSKTSDLTNDSGYITESDILTDYYTKTQSDTKYAKYNDFIQNQNNFGGKKFYHDVIDNAFYNADKRFYVTCTIYKKVVNDVTYPYTDTTKDSTTENPYVDSPIVVSTTTSTHQLFDNTFGVSPINIQPDEYAVIDMRVSQDGVSTFDGYPYGTYLLSYYYNNIPEIASQCRIKSNHSDSLGWNLRTAKNYYSATEKIEQFNIFDIYGRQIVQFVIYGRTSDTRAVWISQIEWFKTRGSMGDISVVHKYSTNKLYDSLTLGDRDTNKIVLNPSGTASFSGSITGKTEDTADNSTKFATTEFVKNQEYAKSTDLPTKTSDLTNDSNFATTSDIPTKTSDLTNDSGFITNSVDNLTNYYDKDTTNDKVAIVKNEVLSMGEQLVINGSASMGNNTNFSLLTFDGSQANYSGGSFTYPQGERTTSECTDSYLPIDTKQKYVFEFDMKSLNQIGTVYSYLLFYDIDQLSIKSEYHMNINNTLTTLSQDLNDGDTIVHLTDLTNWNVSTGNASYKRGFIFWNYKNSYGYQYPANTYSRNVWSNLYIDANVNKTNNTITLTQAWNQGTIPAGTQLSQCSRGRAYKYQGVIGTTIPTTWTHYKGNYDGIDLSGNNVGDKFPPGTAFARVDFMLNYNQQNDKFWLTNVSVKSLAGINEIPTKTSDLTNDSNFATTTQVSTATAYATETTKGTARIWTTTEDGKTILNIATEDAS